MDAMTPRQRFMAALHNRAVDRVPVASPTSVATVELMDATGAFFPAVHTDGETMARLAAGGHDILGFDTVAPIFSIAQEAAALGCGMDWGRKDWMPINTTSPFAEPEDVRIPGDYLEKPSIRACLDAIGILRHRYGDRVAVIGKVMGPWTLSYHARGVQEFLMDTVLDPDKARRFLEVLMPASLLFARAQIEAGADAIVIADHCTGDMVRAQNYRDFLLPLHKVMNRELSFPTILHCCGKALDRMEYFAQAGFTSYHFESKNDPRESMAIVNGRMTLMGNINNPSTLLKGSPADVEREARAAIDAGVQVLAPECAVPLITPNRNLQAIVQAAAAFGKKRL
ncbi:MAG: MtaA/CmuA family methyltransferase [Chloroflexi bacterium]|nr:MtaA/CmuA family methyltransferase [Chloroflexota bacterium]